MRKEVFQEIQKGAERLVMLCRNATVYAEDDSAAERVLRELEALHADAEAYMSQAVAAISNIGTTAARLINHAEAEKRQLLSEIASIRESISQLLRQANEEVAWKRRGRRAVNRS